MIMAERKIRVYGDPVLRLKARKVEDFGEHLKPFVDDMFETCINNEGAGLAAPQVGESIQMLVIHLAQDEQEPIMLNVFNPEILESGGNIAMTEGCLSLPELREELERPEKIKVRYYDYIGKEYVLETDGFLARVFQHEMDHLKGVLFVDHLTPVRKTLLKSKLKKIAAGDIPQ